MWSMPSPGNTDLPVSEDCIDVSARMTCKADESMKNEQGGIVFHALRDAKAEPRACEIVQNRAAAADTSEQ
jgi:hypothetical protein